jgi:glycerol-3-phosphate dehydrogenase
MDSNLRICFIGSGAISTAMANVLSQKAKYDVYLLVFNAQQNLTFNTLSKICYPKFLPSEILVSKKL